MTSHLDDALRRHFDDSIHDRLGDTPVGVVVRRGRRRRARRRSAMMGGTLAIGAVGSVVAVNALSAGGTPRSIQVGTPDTPAGGGEGAPAPDGTGTPAQPAVELAPSPLVWNDVTVGSAEAVSIGEYALPQGLAGGLVVDPAGGFYALSTAPGRGAVTPEAALYHSTDGVTWEQRGAPTLEISPRSNLAAGAGQLYAVGTQAAGSALPEQLDPGQLVLAQSADGGVTWHDEVLPVDLGAVRELEGVRSVRTQASVAASKSTSVIAAVTIADVDLEAFAPDGDDPRVLDVSVPGVVVQREALPCDGVPATTTVDHEATPDSSVPVPDGHATASDCTMFGSEVARFTWDELGIPTATIDAALGQLHLLVSTGDGTYTEIEAPALPAGSRVHDVDVSATGDRFLAVVRWQSAENDAWADHTTTFTSADGTTWEALEAPIAQVTRAGTLADGSFVAIGIDAAGSQLVAVLRDGAWATHPLPTPASAIDGIPLDWSQHVAIGPLGIAVYGQVAQAAPKYQDDADAMYNGSAGATTTVVEPAVGTAPTSTAVPTTTMLPVSTGPAPTTAMPPADGDVTDTTVRGPALPADGYAPGAATTMPYGIASGGTAYDRGSVRSVLLFSRDGISWSADELELTDPALGGYAGVVVTDDHVAVSTLTGAVPYDDLEAPLPDQRVFIGTLAG